MNGYLQITDKIFTTTSKLAAFSPRLILIILGLCIAVFISWPVVLMWALNQLFDLNIEYTILNWLATTVIIWTTSFAVRVYRK